MPTSPARSPSVSSRPPARSALEELLTKAFGVPVALGRLERLAPWAVLRAHLADPGAGLPSSVIVKWPRDDPGGLRDDPRLVATERAALRFLAEDLGFALAPRVLAADAAAPLLVLEDLAPRTPLDRVLRRHGAEPPPAGLVSFARALGELGAATAGHAELYRARRSELGPAGADANATWPNTDGCWPHAVGHAAAFGVPLPGPAERELAGVLAEIADPGPFLCLTNGDSEANNFLVADGDGRIVDFEFAGYRHALTSVVCLYVPGPAWLTVRDPVATGLEAHYRRALARTVPEAGDDHLFGSGLAAACLTWAAARLVRFPQLDARPPGDPSRVQMVSVLECAARVTEDHRVLPRLASWARRAERALRRRWPDADVDLSAYPAYAPRH
ncbi:hypothetical protein ACLQ2R_19445 [Streptosporangium sp. DT93]|uniref:hypothetical protein n=1 Tax=Streptosporangium sp. DT93 TaxID=3393428 RepID=UPI003CE95EAF